MFPRIKNLFLIKGYLIFTICMMLLGVAISVTSPYLSLFCTENLGMSTGAYGVFMALSLLSGVLVNSLIAKRSDSGLERKWIIITALISSALGYVSFLIFHNFYILLIVFTILNGLGAAAMPQIYASAQEAANEINAYDKVFAMSTLRSLFSLGFLLGPLAGVLILQAVGYNGLFIGTSAVFILIATFVALSLPKRKEVKSNIRMMNDSNVSILKIRDIRQPLIAFTLLFAVNTFNSNNTPLFIVNDLKGTHADVGLLVSFSAGLEIPIMIMLGALSKKISNHLLMIITCFIAFFYYSVLSLASSSWQLIAAQLLQATFVAILMGNGLSYFSELLPNSPGLSSTIYSNGSTMGRLIGNLSCGIIAQYAGFRHVYWVCLAIVIVSFFILWSVKPSKEISE